MWPGASRSLNYGGHGEMAGMVGLRDVFVVAHHHHHPAASSFHHQNDVVMPDLHGVGVGVIPLLTAAPCDNSGINLAGNRSRGGGGGIQLWPPQDHHYNMKKQAVPEISVAHAASGHGGGGGNASSGGGATMTCQDCGNQAKKDCTHRRCRTCCKSRGFDCPTHVKSTWVPASRRRERQLMAAAAATAAGGSSGATSGSKKPRLIGSQTTTTSHTSTSNTTPPRSFDTSSSHQDASFKETLPGQVRAPAVFKCVRVTAVDEGDGGEYAYQAVVKIAGHVFKGVLYDQGVESRDSYPNLSELHLGGGGGGGDGGSSGGGGGRRNGATSSSPMLDPSDVYAATAGGFLAGSTYGNPIN